LYAFTLEHMHMQTVLDWVHATLFLLYKCIHVYV
jgi:hypothetical protein